MQLTLHNCLQSRVTLVENEFIDHYMTKASGEYVKVYLLLLRYLGEPSSPPSISRLADQLENTEGDIVRALKYWEKAGLLFLSYNQSQEITAISFGQKTNTEPSVAPAPAPTPVSPAPELTLVPEPVQPQEKKGALTSTQRKELQQILFIAQQYLGKTLSRTEVDAISYFYDTLNFSADLIEYLIEYCVENGHKSMHYIQKVALAWFDEHITTVEQARNSSSLYNRTCYSVLQAFGIKGRGPATSELEYIKRWSEVDGFDLSVILEACNRTVIAIHQPSFEYADKILQNWKLKNVHTIKDIHALDLAYEQSKAGQPKSTPKSPAPPATSSKFRNFEERNYDMDELTKELLKID